MANAALGIFVGVAGAIVAGLVAASIKVANQWERGLVLRLGEFRSIRGPGLFFVVPIIDRVRMVDTRVLAVDIPRQEAITKDNVPVSINGALFFKVTNVEDAVMKIQDYVYGISLLAQTALRDVVGGMVLDDLLSERERIGKQVEQAVENDSKEWGLHVTGIRLMDIDMPEDLKRIMSRQAGAEREKRATITKAEGDRLAAENLAAAAATMLASPGAMQLRTLQTLDGLGPDRLQHCRTGHSCRGLAVGPAVQPVRRYLNRVPYTVHFRHVSRANELTTCHGSGISYSAWTYGLSSAI